MGFGYRLYPSYSDYGDEGVGMKRIVVHIDNLVLRGFRHEDRHAIAAAVETELTRLFAEPGAASHLANTGDVSRLAIGTVQLAQGTKPEGVGTQIAQGITRGITR